MSNTTKRTAKPKRTLVNSLFSEIIEYGGVAMTRRQVQEVMQAEGHDKRAIDFFAFGTPSLACAVGAWEHNYHALYGNNETLEDEVA